MKQTLLMAWVIMFPQESSHFELLGSDQITFGNHRCCWTVTHKPRPSESFDSQRNFPLAHTMASIISKSQVERLAGSQCEGESTLRVTAGTSCDKEDTALEPTGKVMDCAVVETAVLGPPSTLVLTILNGALGVAVLVVLYWGLLSWDMLCLSGWVLCTEIGQKSAEAGPIAQVLRRGCQKALRAKLSERDVAPITNSWGCLSWPICNAWLETLGFPSPFSGSLRHEDPSLHPTPHSQPDGPFPQTITVTLKHLANSNPIELADGMLHSACPTHTKRDDRERGGIVIEGKRERERERERKRARMSERAKERAASHLINKSLPLCLWAGESGGDERGQVLKL
ncbi:hypothetical protein JZ751_018356 [Albula glossodonta]|uniref:Uncharacterized protein n=1 Tax=Albula glossodonta TaxID=121402 RepID=A0A8T2NX82_9TELE|nr:hypothetical protein JZ751_018356 [Albula glossodonta]